MKLGWKKIKSHRWVLLCGGYLAMYIIFIDGVQKMGTPNEMLPTLALTSIPAFFILHKAMLGEDDGVR